MATQDWGGFGFGKYQGGGRFGRSKPLAGAARDRLLMEQQAEHDQHKQRLPGGGTVHVKAHMRKGKLVKGYSRKR